MNNTHWYAYDCKTGKCLATIVAPDGKHEAAAIGDELRRRRGWPPYRLSRKMPKHENPPIYDMNYDHI